MWKSLDKLSKLAPFNAPNTANVERNLSAHIEKYPNAWSNFVNGKEILEYTMDTFTLKDDDGNSIHYSDSEDEEEEGKEGKSNAASGNKKDMNFSITDGELDTHS